jgi:hypothetical protein
MQSMINNRQIFRATIIHRIERQFRNSVVIWTGNGSPDEELTDIEEFEALWIPEEKFRKFRDFIWELQQNVAKPNGYHVMVHGYSPEITRNHRWAEYLEGRKHQINPLERLEPVSALVITSEIPASYSIIPEEVLSYRIKVAKSKSEVLAINKSGRFGETQEQFHLAA